MKSINKYLKTLKSIYNFNESILKISIFYLFLLISIFISQKSFAEINYNESLVVETYEGTDTPLTSNNCFLSHYNNTCLGNTIQKDIDYNGSWEYQFFVDNHFYTYKHPSFEVRRTSTQDFGFKINTKVTLQNCLDSGFHLAKIPTGFSFEGRYLCVLNDRGEDVYIPEPVDPIDPIDPNEILTPEAFDDYYCSTYFDNESVYEYFYLEYSLLNEYSKTMYQDTFDVFGVTTIFTCPVGGCSYELMLENARSVLPNLPEERFFPISSASDPQNYFSFNITPNCKITPIAMTNYDITDDEIDCRKVNYSISGHSGVGLSTVPENQCYFKTDETGEPEKTFKKWCSDEFGQKKTNPYWTNGFTESCTLSDQIVEKIETSSDITTIYESYEYTTDLNNQEVVKSVTRETFTEDKETGVITSNGPVTTTTNIDKSEIVNNYTINNQSNSGSNSSSNSSYTETVSSYGEAKSWIEPTFEGGFSGVLSKNNQEFQNGELYLFIQGLNPFSTTGNFPTFKFNAKIGDIVDFGHYEIDFTQFQMADRTLNLISLFKMLLLISASIYAFRQIF